MTDQAEIPESAGSVSESVRRSRKEIKRDAVAAAREEKDARTAIKALPPKERKAAENAAKETNKREKAARQAARKQMPRSERKADKREARIFRKVAHRRRRAVGWGIVAVVVVGVAVAAAPYVSDIRRLFSITANSETAEGQAAREAGMRVANQVSDEGLVLLKNDGDLLPVRDGKINVFGFASFNVRYGGGGSGGADLSQAVNLYDALQGAGIEYNPELFKTMQDNGASLNTANSTGLVQVIKSFVLPTKEDEKAPTYLTDEVMEQAAQFSDVALVVIGNDGVEAQDFAPEQLRLTQVQRDLLDRISSRFENIVVIINSGNQMELGFLDEYPQIKSALWIGTPGPFGTVSLADTLAGDINPSGRLSNTYAYDVETAPATVNFGDYKYENAKRAFLNYQEGIYVGYRYYETRYEADEAGYQQAVQFPFGYGLSYTDFEWKVSEPVIDADQIAIVVEVTNSGSRAGKDVVQVYYTPPWSEGGIEKSSKNLVAYQKTSEIAPGDTETVKLVFPVRDMSSWDESGGGGYVLDAGGYKIHVSSDAHNSVAAFDYVVPTRVEYRQDEVTGTELMNLFPYAHGDFSYLSRGDWEGTYPNPDDRNYVASQELLDAMFPKDIPAEGELPIYGADNGIMLADLKGLSFNDAKWDLFLDQLTKEEQVNLFSRGGWKTESVDRLGIPSTVLLDGPAGLNSFFSNVTAASYPTAATVASTWNDELAQTIGDAVGEEANAYGVQGWYAPGMNIQRSALGGRNFEYYSEDPLLSGKMGAAMVRGAENQGIVTFMKHFVLNDQEINARSGVNVFANEQAMRELYLRPFEITVKEGGGTGAMSSFIHIGPIWSGGNSQLLQDLLREQWGFEGVVSTDAVLGGFMNPTFAALNGNDLILSAMGSATAKTTMNAVNHDPVGVGNALRERVHQICYMVLESNLFD